MPKMRPRIERVRRRTAVRAFACGFTVGILVGVVAVASGGEGLAALLLAISMGALSVLVLGVHIGMLRARGDRLEDMLGAVSAGLIVLDRREVCVATGGHLDELLEMPGDWNPIGRTITEILTDLADRGDFGPRIPPCTPVDPGLLRSPEFSDIYIDTPRGRVLSVAVSRLPDDGWVLTYTDITEQKEQTRMLYRAQRELAVSEARAQRLARDADAANTAKSAFLAAMSHEIRTPMNGIIGMSDILAESDLTEEQRGLLETIRQSGESLLVIINGILDFSKIEAGRMALETVTFDLRRTVDDVLKLVFPKAREQGIELTLDYPSDLPERFVGDPQRLRQVLINLVGNAVKFTPEGSVGLAVRGHAEGREAALEIVIADTGIGIEAKDLRRIFGEFDRVDQSSTRRFEGTGLGLAITRRLVDMMGGEIAVDSEPGKGTTFTVRLTLPLAPGRAPAGAPPVSAPPLIRRDRRLSVLLAEDNRTNRMVVEKMLADQPIDLHLAGNGREAVELFRELRPDLVLMDISMPEMDGFAATAAIRETEATLGLPRTVVIALTANAMEGDREICLENDMDDYLSKPLRKAGLVGMIRAHAPPAEPPRLRAAR